MSRIVMAVLLGAAFVFCTPMTEAAAQTPAVKEAPAADKAADRKAKSEARKAAAAERRAKTAERKSQAKASRAAAHERQKQCGAEWKKLRTDNKVEKGMTWPKYYSDCNKRLKGKAA
jgi:hypothetical protein